MNITNVKEIKYMEKHQPALLWSRHIPSNAAISNGSCLCVIAKLKNRVLVNTNANLV